MPSAQTPHDPDHQRRVHGARTRIARIATLLDGLFTVPGTRIRVGLDSIIGLLPGIGDVAGLLLGGTILVESVRVGAPGSLIARMLSNIVVDTVGGAVPVVGDLFDVAFRSHARNARLLLDHLDAQARVEAPRQRHGAWVMALILLALVALLGLIGLGLYSLIRSFF